MNSSGLGPQGQNTSRFGAQGAGTARILCHLFFLPADLPVGADLGGIHQLHLGDHDRPGVQNWLREGET
jgi:hypothetical protein